MHRAPTCRTRHLYPPCCTSICFLLYQFTLLHIAGYQGIEYQEEKMPAQATKKERKEKTIKLPDSHWTLKSLLWSFWYALDNGKRQVITLIEQNAKMKMKKTNRNSLSLGKLGCSKKGDQHVVQGSWTAWQWPKTVPLSNAFFILHQNR